MELLIVGDQSSESFEPLHSPEPLQCGLVQDFLALVEVVLRSEISSLPEVTRRKLPNLSFREANFEAGVYHPVLRPALTATSQLVTLLQYLDATKPAKFSNHCLVGSCTGSLVAAAAAAIPQSLSNWISLAAYVVRVAFRIGLHTAAVGDRFQKVDGPHESWSSVVHGRLSQGVLTEFHLATNLPEPYHAYISATTPNSTTISGPPRTLQRLFASEQFQETGYLPVSIPVFAPYHAPHLHRSADVDWVLALDDPAAQQMLDGYSQCSVLLSTRDGKPIHAPGMADLFRTVVHETLVEVVQWDAVVSAVTAAISEPCPVNITVVGSTGLSKSLSSALRVTVGGDIRLTSATEFPKPKVTHTTPQGPKIAIIGMAGRFPGATNLEELWQLLLQGHQACKMVSPDRFEAPSHVDNATLYGCFIDEPALFDPLFFRMSAREAAVTDPMQRLALLTAYEALEMSGFVPNRTPSSMLDSVGTFYGQTLDDYREFNASQNIDAFYVTGGLRSFGPGRINYFYKFTGPSYSIDTACSSSLAAIHIACESLRRKECDMAVAGGTNIITGPAMYTGLSRGQFLSKTGSCKTFDNDADGYCRADGVGTLILKRLEDAEADNDPILGVVLASATNHSSQASSITQPHGPTQERLFRMVLRHAGLGPSEIDYIEMHGTGTQIGDSTEMRSVCSVFGNCNRPDPHYVGSIKPNLGHSEAAAGVTSMIKGLLMFQNNLIPAHVGVKGQLNASFPALVDNGIVIPTETTRFDSKSNRKRRILVNNFGAAGGNTTILLEEPPAAPSNESTQPRCVYPIAISAKAPSSLNQNKNRLVAFLRSAEGTTLRDLSYTTTSRRLHYRHRFIAVVSTVQELERTLLSPSPGYTIEKPALVFAFTGQGSVYSGVANGLFQASSQFRTDILQFDALAQAQGLPSFFALLDPSVELGRLSTIQTQLGQICIQMALYRLYRSWGATPQAVIGHSLGEYAALYASGVLTASDTIFLVGRRAELMDQHCTPGTHTMTAVRAPYETVCSLISDTSVEVTCINGPSDVVLGGSVHDMQLITTTLSSNGISSIPLSVPFACHSAQLDPIIEPFRTVASGVDFHTPTVPLLSPLFGTEIRGPGVIDSDYLCRHLREKVDFATALQSSTFLKSQPTAQFVEVGPQPLCSRMVRSTLGQTTVPLLRKGEDSWKTATDALAALYMRGIDIDWAQYNRDIGTSAVCMSDLPSYAFDETDHWINYQKNSVIPNGNHVSRVDRKPPGPATSSVQRLIRQSPQTECVQVEFESDLQDPALFEAISGHVINDVGLCPSSVFADMAFTAAQYLYDNNASLRVQGELEPQILDMEILSPVILDLSQKQHAQLLHITASLMDGKVMIEFSDPPTAAGKQVTYGKCAVVWAETAKIHRQWRRNAHLVQARITHLQSMGTTHRLYRGMAYRIFGAVVEYSEIFHGMDEIFIDSQGYEATARVSFKFNARMETFHRNPYWIDNVTQLPGFIMNANETIDPAKVVYISNGWESMHLGELSPQHVYTVYAKMQSANSSIVSGDVYIMDDQDEIIGFVGGVRFQAVPRPLLKLLLQPPSNRAPARLTADHASTPNLSTSSGHEPPYAPVSNGVHSSGESNGIPLMSIVLETLGEELGMSIDDLGQSLTLAEIGLDSLMSLTILGRLRESFSLDLPSTLFQQDMTVNELVTTLKGRGNGKMPNGKIPNGKIPNGKTPNGVTQPSSSAPALHNSSAVAATRSHRATTVLLQGDLTTTTSMLFLFPGGFGTASTFTPMPFIHQDLAIFGLNSAFVSKPEDFTVTVPEMAALYVGAIQARQSHGPYSLLGYSVGGVLAYEASRQLIEAGEAVERLYLVDAPCPLVIPPMPPSLIQFLDSIDRFSGKSKEVEPRASEPVKPMGSLHVMQTLTSLETYMPTPLPSGVHHPRTTYYVAREGVSKQATSRLPAASESDRKVMTWLLDDRTGNGGTGDGWEMLVDRAQVKVFPVGGNHFSIMKEPHILEWANELRVSYWS